MKLSGKNESDFLSKQTAPQIEKYNLYADCDAVYFLAPCIGGRIITQAAAVKKNAAE